MTKSEAKALAQMEYSAWREPYKVNATEPLAFFTHLQNNMPHILMYRSKYDKYQDVAGWVTGWSMEYTALENIVGNA